MDASGLAAIAFAGIGGALIVIALSALLPRRLNVAAANHQLIKLADARNIERARKLCGVGPGTWMDAVAAAIDAIPHGNSDRLAIEAAVNSAYDKAAVTLVTRWRAVVQRGLFGAILVVGGVALAASTPNLHMLAILGGVGDAVAGLLLLSQVGYLTTSLATTRAAVLPAIATAATTSIEPAPEAPTPAIERELRAAAIATPAPLEISLKDGTCPLCKGTVIKTVERDDGRFKALVCAHCGYAQEFANLDKLEGG